MPRRHQQPADDAPAAIDTISKTDRQLNDLQSQITELRQLLVELMQHQGLDQAGTRKLELIRAVGWALPTIEFMVGNAHPTCSRPEN
jgi:hypothetical protein